MLKEFCAENFTNIPAAIEKGADRIELCDNLAVGGTTVSYGVLQQALAYARPHQVPVYPLIRPRGGDFIYSEIEKAIMRSDLQIIRALGAEGFVIGALTPEGALDIDFLREVRDLAPQMDITFHMAFDEIEVDQQVQALHQLKALGIHRVLTHGGPPESTLFDHISHLLHFVSGGTVRLCDYAGRGLDS